MCTNRREVYNRYLGRKLVTDCGKCPACLQKKANARARRIEAEFNEDLDDRAFITLTYKNQYIPYVTDNDIQEFFSGRRLSLPIYRDYNRRLVYDARNKVYKEKDFKLKKPIEVLTREDFKTSDFDRHEILDTWYSFLRTSGNRFGSFELGKIGVPYYRDVQNFIKRLRINLYRNGYENKVRFYACTELGPTTHRPHIHLLLYFPKGHYSLIKTACVKSWLFDDIHKRYANIEAAYSPSQYLASYVNCDSSIKGLFRYCKPFKPKHSYSQGFGINKDVFSLGSLEKMYDRRNFGINQRILRNGVPTDIIIPVPKYVVSRFFPKFKGYGKLTPFEVFHIVKKPEIIHDLETKLGLTSSDSRAIFIRLLNLKRKYSFCSNYAYLYANIWNARSAYMLRYFHETIYKDDPLEAYDNILKYFSGEISSDFVSLDERSHYEIDFNKFASVVNETNRLTQSYLNRSKDRKKKNLAYSQHQNV